MDALQQFGIRLIQALQTLSPSLDGVMYFFTFLGRVEFYLLIAPFIYWLADRRLGMRALIILICTDAITSSLKLLFHQPRPYWIGGVEALSHEGSYGIPSGHASDSLAVGGYLAHRARRKWFLIVMGIVIFFIGLSRLYLGVHFPHDVLFGWLIGATVLWVAIKQSDRIVGWARSLSISAQVGIGFLFSVAIILLGVIIRALIAGTPDPASWSSYATEARSLDHFFTLAAATFGSITGYAWMRQYARFRPPKDLAKRVLSYVIGLVGLLLIYLGLDIAFSLIAADETILGYTLRFIRYTLVTIWVTFGAPWVFLRTRLAEPEAGVIDAKQRLGIQPSNS